MEFSFSIHPFLKDEITVIDRNHDLLKCTFRRSYSKENSHREEVRELINKLGVNSAKAQGLNGSITSVEQLRTSEQRCYILKDTDSLVVNGAVIGFLKVGAKKLFFINQESQQVEVTPLCVLDFYVHESAQRKGHGLKLFKFMMENEGVSPASLAIDRPSDKMLGFYKKKFSLSAPLKQPNNFVVFRDFFSFYVSTSSKRWTDQQRRGPIKLKVAGVTNSTKASSSTTDNNGEFPVPNQNNPTVPQQPPDRSYTAPSRPVAAPSRPVAAPEIKLPSVFDRPLSGFVRSNSRGSNSHESKSHGSNSNGSTGKVSSALPNIRKESAVPSRTPFSWSRNTVAVNYVVGGVSNHLLKSRYSHFDRPRPF